MEVVCNDKSEDFSAEQPNGQLKSKISGNRLENDYEELLNPPKKF